MAVYRIHLMKEGPRQNFRWAPHVSGAAQVKPRDYEPDGEIDAPNEYAAWGALRDTGRPLAVGDILELPGGELRICKYVGFEVAQWFTPEPKPGAEATQSPPAAPSGESASPPA